MCVKVGWVRCGMLWGMGGVGMVMRGGGRWWELWVGNGCGERSRGGVWGCGAGMWCRVNGRQSPPAVPSPTSPGGNHSQSKVASASGGWGPLRFPSDASVNSGGDFGGNFGGSGAPRRSEPDPAPWPDLEGVRYCSHGSVERIWKGTASSRSACSRRRTTLPQARRVDAERQKLCAILGRWRGRW